MKSILSTVAMVLMLPILSHMQVANPYAGKQVAAPVPKLALLGAVKIIRSGVKHSKISFTVQNREKYDPSMFIIGAGPALPPNPCGTARTRIVVEIFSERGESQASCIQIPSQNALYGFSYLHEQRRALPKFVYAVLTDRQTGAAYRSNLISPVTGLAK